MVVLVRVRPHQPTLDYLACRLAEGKTKDEIMRCLKRYIIREHYSLMQPSNLGTTGFSFESMQTRIQLMAPGVAWNPDTP